MAALITLRSWQGPLDKLLPPGTLSAVSLLADAFFKAAVSLLPAVPRVISVEGKQRSSEPFLLDFINNFLSTLLVVPVSLATSCSSARTAVALSANGLLNLLSDVRWLEQEINVPLNQNHQVRV